MIPRGTIRLTTALDQAMPRSVTQPFGLGRGAPALRISSARPRRRSHAPHLPGQLRSPAEPEHFLPGCGRRNCLGRRTRTRCPVLHRNGPCTRRAPDPATRKSPPQTRRKSPLLPAERTSSACSWSSSRTSFSIETGTRRRQFPIPPPAPIKTGNPRRSCAVLDECAVLPRKMTMSCGGSAPDSSSSPCRPECRMNGERGKDEQKKRRSHLPLGEDRRDRREGRQRARAARVYGHNTCAEKSSRLSQKKSTEAIALIERSCGAANRTMPLSDCRK
jgi:hypothetical protein